MTETSEIHRVLSSIREKPFTRGEMSYAKENQREHGIRKDLVKIRPSILWRLEGRGFVWENSQGQYQLTNDGLSLLTKFEEEGRKYGKGNVKIIPTIVEDKKDKTTYRVKVKPKVKLKMKTETQPSETIPEVTQTVSEPHPQPPEDVEYDKRKKRMLSFPSGKVGPIESVNEEKGFLIIKTRIDYHRTTEERKRLDEIAKKFATEIKTNDWPECRDYIFKRGKQPVVTVVSKKGGKGFKSHEPLEIKVDLTKPTKSAEKLISYLIEEFYKKR